MGHKEELLAGAKASLLERGYANTTARDIVAASHTNLASIGYHYGSLDALLTTAMMEMMGEWGDKFAVAARGPDLKSGEARFRAVWRQILKLFETDRALMVASYEIGVQAARSDELRAIFAATFAEVRMQMPEDFLEAGQMDAKTRRAVGSVLLALISGLTVQHLLDPKGAPNAEEITLAMKAIGKAVGS